MDELTLINNAIADLAEAAKTAPVRSKETAYETMAELTVVREELFPSTVEGIVRLCAQHSIGADEFISALRQRYEANFNKC